MTNRKIHCMSFGTYSRTLTVGFTGGIRVFSFTGTATFELLFESSKGYSDVYCAECVGTLVVFVQFRSPRQLVLLDYETATQVNTLDFVENISTFRLNTHIIVVRLTHSIHVFDSSSQEALHCLTNVMVESPALALCPCTLPTYFAFPSVPYFGYVTVCNVLDALNSEHTFKVSDRNIAHLEFNSSGDLLAAAAFDGTVLQVFNVVTGQVVHQFRRALSRNVLITCLLFVDEHFLVCSSDSDSVHIFEMNPHAPSVLGMAANFLSSAVAMLPFGSAITMQRSAIAAKIPSHGFQTRSFMWRHEGICWLCVASFCGGLHVFIVDMPSRQCILMPKECHVLRMGCVHATISQCDDESLSVSSFPKDDNPDQQKDD